MTPTDRALRDIQDFYDRVAFLYPLVDLFLSRAKRRHLVAEVNRLSPGILLDIGVGTGSHLRGYRHHEITGVDASRAMLGYARRRHPSHVRLLQMDGEKLTFATGSFDYAVLSHVLAVTPNPEQMLREAHRVVRPGGKVLILNHDSPRGWLGLLDRACQPLTPLLRCRTHFQVTRIAALGSFSSVESRWAAAGGYEKLFVCTR